MNDIKPSDYIKIVRRPYPPLYGSLLLRGVTIKAFSAPLVPKDAWLFRKVILADKDWWYVKDEIENGGQVLLQHWLDTDNYFQGVEVLHKREVPLHNAAQLSFDEFSEAYSVYGSALTLIASLDRPVAAYVTDLLVRATDAIEAERLMDKLNVPLKDNYYREEEYNLAVTEDLEAHVEKYAWVFARYGNDVSYTLKQAKGRRATMDVEAYLKEREESQESVKETIALTKELLGPADSQAIDLLQFIIHYRTQRTDVLNKSTHHFMTVAKELAAERGLTYEEFLHLMPAEVDGNIPDKIELHSRIEDFALIGDDGDVELHTGQAALAITEVFKEKMDDTNQLTGVTAAKGNVVGTVRMVLSRNDFASVLEGDILVTSMTTPEMIPIMKKAGAFVTDEGGVTCHAAIISREMKKPCIIGTKIATKVLKDGMEVEVDADRGMVKIID